jgi:hypothetical protein
VLVLVLVVVGLVGLAILVGVVVQGQLLESPRLERNRVVVGEELEPGQVALAVLALLEYGEFHERTPTRR